MQIVTVGGKTYFNGRPVTKYQCNGCGSAWTAWLVPDWLPGLPLHGYCCEHDWAYWRGGGESHRNAADFRFKRRILSRGIGKSRLFRAFVRCVARLYWRAVDRLGDNGSFVYTKSGEPREPVEIEGEYFFYDDEELGYNA